jgi:protein tyrosine phosphatase (PTP) superfamily phosphohydrolase (DUF442 family)
MILPARLPLALVLLLGLPLAAGCHATPDAEPAQPSEPSATSEAPAPAPPAEPPPPPALVLQGTAYDTALVVTLPPESPEEYEGLHNVFKLSEDIISGSEPHGPEALAELQRLGVKTIISVDGKVPDAQTASAYGLRYVHIPIQYKGVTEEERAEIAKTFRELDGPFYVHCFHGKHRGPAAAAIGRIVLDGADRQTAIAEMRQYCGTSSKYEGLYRDIATAYFPTEAETRALAFDFPTEKRPKGVAGVMVGISRASDNLDLLQKSAFAADPAHPDVDAANEAEILAQSFEAALELDEVKHGPEDFRGWFEDAAKHSREVVDALARAKQGAEGAAQEADKSWKAAKDTCNACHKAYRD